MPCVPVSGAYKPSALNPGWMGGCHAASGGGSHCKSRCQNAPPGSRCRNAMMYVIPSGLNPQCSARHFGHGERRQECQHKLPSNAWKWGRKSPSEWPQKEWSGGTNTESLGINAKSYIPALLQSGGKSERTARPDQEAAAVRVGNRLWLCNITVATRRNV